MGSLECMLDRLLPHVQRKSLSPPAPKMPFHFSFLVPKSVLKMCQMRLSFSEGQ